MGAATPRLSARGHDSAEREPLKQDDGSPADLKETDDDRALADGGPPPELFSRAQRGYLAQYLVVGLIYGGLPATSYGLFNGYLNVPGHIYVTTQVVISFPWALKFFFGALTDCVPIRGLRRKPYMCLGWALCALALATLSLRPLPPPYWCTDADGRYITKVGNVTATPCSESSAKQGGPIALLMSMAVSGYVLADVAADGLTATFARREPRSSRGRTQAGVYFCRTLGKICAGVLVGFGMNSYEYNGTFATGLSFNAICAIFSLFAAVMVPVSWMCVDEPVQTKPYTIRAYWSVTHRLLSSRAMYFVVLHAFASTMIAHVSTTAGPLVKR